MFLLCFCGLVLTVVAFPVENNNNISPKEWYCNHICKMSSGDPYYDVHTEKCYCTIRKELIDEEKECKDEKEIKTNPKNEIHDLHIILREAFVPNNRVRRSESETGETTEPQEVPVQPTDSETKVKTVEDEPTEPSAEPEAVIPEETTSETPNEVPIVAAETPITIENNLNTNSDTAQTVVTKNTDETSNSISMGRKPVKPFQKIAGVSKLGAARQRPLNELLVETQQKVDSFVERQSQGMNPKEAQVTIRDIQATLNQLSARIKQEDKPQSLQERINQLSEKLASRHKTDTPIIVQPTETEGTSVNEQPEGPIIGSRRHYSRTRPSIRSHSKLPHHESEHEEIREKIKENREEHEEERERIKTKILHEGKSGHNKEREEGHKSRFSPIKKHHRERLVGAKNPEETETTPITDVTSDTESPNIEDQRENEVTNE